MALDLIRCPNSHQFGFDLDGLDDEGTVCCPFCLVSFDPDQPTSPAELRDDVSDAGGLETLADDD